MSWLFTGQLSWRELDDIINALPVESALRTKLREQYTDEQLAEFSDQQESSSKGPWSKQDLLLASLIWELRQLVFIQLAAGGVKSPAAPEPIHTPGVVRKSNKTDPRALAYLQEIRERHRREAG